MSLPSFKVYVSDHFASQADAARSLHMSVQQFSRIVNGLTPVGWGLVGRVAYFWQNKKFLPGVETLVSELGDCICHNGAVQ